MTRRDVTILLASALPLAFAGCTKWSISYRYRMTVEVDTPQGPRSASSVIEVNAAQGVAFPGPEAGGIGMRARGEAVTIDFPDGQTMFALLNGSGGAGVGGYAPVAIAPDRPDRGSDGKAAFNNIKIMKTRRQVAELPPKYYPMLVRFRDLRDPRSVELVDPDDLAASFGPGVKLKRITIQITDDPVTTGIDKKLAWLRTLRGYLDGGMTNKNAPYGLDKGAFSTGILK